MPHRPDWRQTGLENWGSAHLPDPECSSACLHRYSARPGNHDPRPDGGSGICLIGGKPAARVGDIVMEPGALIPLPPPNSIVMGEFTVLIGMGGGAGAGGGAGGGGGSKDGCKDCQKK